MKDKNPELREIINENKLSISDICNITGRKQDTVKGWLRLNYKNQAKISMHDLELIREFTSNSKDIIVNLSRLDYLLNKCHRNVLALKNSYLIDNKKGKNNENN